MACLWLAQKIEEHKARTLKDIVLAYFDSQYRKEGRKFAYGDQYTNVSCVPPSFGFPTHLPPRSWLLVVQLASLLGKLLVVRWRNEDRGVDTELLGCGFGRLVFDALRLRDSMTIIVVYSIEQRVPAEAYCGGKI